MLTLDGYGGNAHASVSYALPYNYELPTINMCLEHCTIIMVFVIG